MVKKSVLSAKFEKILEKIVKLNLLRAILLPILKKGVCFVL